MMRYFVYILECADGSLYTGSTNNLEKRLRHHNGAKSGAHYTKIRRPVVLRYAEACVSVGEARSRESEIKRLTRTQKQSLIHSARVVVATRRVTISSLSAHHKNMGKGNNAQRKEKKKPKKGGKK